jgi:hypothetical protein
MFVNAVGPFLLATLLAAPGSPPSGASASRSCSDLAKAREEADAASTRLAAWMERHCPGSLETSEPFCKLQSGLLLERLAELADLKAAIAVQRCELGPVGDPGAQGAYLIPRTIGSFDDNWPWPRRRPFQAGLAATAGFKIRRCRADPDCEW